MALSAEAIRAMDPGGLEATYLAHRKLRKAFKDHTDQVKLFLVLIGDAMNRLEGVERGRRIADLCNKLELKNDLVRRFTLEIDFNGKPLKRRQMRR